MRFIPLFLLILAAAGCSRKGGETGVEASSRPAETVLTVKTAVAETRQVDRSMMVTGSLSADESVNLGFEVPGTVQKVYADFGQNVRRGQVIAELDTRELAWQLERSRAALSQALARLGLEPAQEEASPESTPAMRQAQAQLEDARFKFESASKLVKSGDISQERFNELEKAYRAREAAFQGARDDLRTQLAAVQGLRAEVKLAQKRVADAVLRAPFDGAVAARLASPGQYLKENTPLFTIVKSSPLRLRAEIPESATGEVQLGRSLSFTTDAAPGAVFHAVVRQLNPALDPRSRSLTAEARLVESDPRLRPGMFVNVELVMARQAGVVVVPRSAIYNVAGLNKVFTVRNGAVTEHKVQPGQVLGEWVVLPGGIQAGDRVATSNLGALVNGMKVNEG